ncbi:phosphoribosylanthranilate isomerase [Flavobacterium luteum]|uniref:N-(5'-phosphoribosyl)anthranilate isomerase n=1 Tax=Flavobacterium luteum TaxID=2026654 RepID=A0A7J5AJ35_9FLAO|nr:phosphoribosylanthranilate isomerase [Flavobacterium luteum]KAB1157627.1 phosphoribosylanthranilate isomerase [Flavobacterium luteum]
MKLKICGMKYPKNILEVSELLPDYMGFIFWDKSSRFFDGVMPDLPKSIQKVGVFVDATLNEIVSKIKKYNLNLIQLHGNESVEFCENLKKESIPIIKVFSLNDDFNFKVLKPYEGVCDYFLFDTKGKLPGGNGIAFNWEVLKKYPSTKPFFLSGGIGIEEIASVKQLLKTNLPIHTIDINSKFEIEPGLKNIQLLKDFKINKNELSR